MSASSLSPTLVFVGVGLAPPVVLVVELVVAFIITTASVYRRTNVARLSWYVSRTQLGSAAPFFPWGGVGDLAQLATAIASTQRFSQHLVNKLSLFQSLVAT
jgi:hypothetical protein